MTREEARREGVEAAKAGVPRSACPYLGWITALTSAWWAGWDAYMCGYPAPEEDHDMKFGKDDPRNGGNK